MFCKQCGKSIREEEKFCGVCGNKTTSSNVSDSGVKKGISTGSIVLIIFGVFVVLVIISMILLYVPILRY